MRKVYLFSLLVACVLSMFAKRVEPYSGSRIFWDMKSQQTVLPDGWYGRMIQLQDGRLMAASESRWKVTASYSDDMGETWSPQETIITPPDGWAYFDVDLVQLSDGKILITYNNCYPDFAPGGRWGVRVRISEDNGATWSDDIVVYDGEPVFHDGTWEPNILELPSGELHLYVSDEAPYTNSGEQCIQLFKSFDKGYTWEGPQSISFRAGARDGMPTAVLLGDTIVVAIEDSAWPGTQSFVPVTVRTTIDECWGTRPVSGNSPLRSQMVDYNWCPEIFGGAPYLRVLQSGETIMSRQSYFKSGDYGVMNCFVYVGDENARNFKAMSQPFPDNMESRISIEVNSVSVVGDSLVYALGGFYTRIGGYTDIVRGFPFKTLHGYYGTPVLDGAVGETEYHSPLANQVKMGNNSLMRCVYADFNYDDENLYFVATVEDDTPMRDQSYSRLLKDGVKLMIDADNVSDDTPVKGMYEFFLLADGAVQCRRGEAGSWRNFDAAGVKSAVTVEDDRYVIEAAIPWSVMDKEGAPVGQRMAVGVEVNDRRGNSFKSESIPDVRHDESWTWVEFRLDGDRSADGVEEVAYGSSPTEFSTADGQLTVKGGAPLQSVTLYGSDGRALVSAAGTGSECSLPLEGHGVLIARVVYSDGTTVCRKIVNR